jgi:two-component system NtrC family sensor kinase
MSRARLIPQTPDSGLNLSSYPVGRSVTIGRHPENDLVPSSDSVSRYHARIEYADGFYELRDLNSSNGTFVNSRRVKDCVLRSGDSVQFGELTMIFEEDRPRASSSQMHLARPASPAKAFPNAFPKATPVPEDDSGVIRLEEIEQLESATMITSVLQPEEIRRVNESSSFLNPKTYTDTRSLVRLAGRLKVLYLLSEMLRESSPDESEKGLLDAALGIFFESLKADRAVIMTRVSVEQREMEVAALRYRDKPIKPERLPVSRSILEEVLNRKVAVLCTDAQEDLRFGASESIVTSQIRSAICVPMIREDQVLGVIHMDIKSSLLRFDQADLEFVTLISNELSMALDNRRMQQEALHRERLAAIGETIAHVTHNVKNILLLMQGGRDLMSKAMEARNVDMARDSWGVVSRGIDRIGRLMQEMLEFSSNKKHRHAYVDVNEMICGIAHDIEDKLIHKGITLELGLIESMPQRLLDETGLHRTLLNLIVNAIEAMPAGSGNIRVRTDIASDHRNSLVIVISDNGVGIPPDKLQKIFLPFFTTKGSHGTGLGLAMCRKAIEDMGGTITVESAVNVGTTFTIRIPRSAEETV